MNTQMTMTLNDGTSLLLAKLMEQVATDGTVSLRCSLSDFDYDVVELYEKLTAENCDNITVNDTDNETSYTFTGYTKIQIITKVYTEHTINVILTKPVDNTNDDVTNES